MASGSGTPFFISNVSEDAMRETVASLNAGNRHRNFPRSAGRKTIEAMSKNKTPSVTGNTQMACKVDNARMVAPGILIPMPPNMSPKLGPMTQFHKNASASETKNATNITMSG